MKGWLFVGGSGLLIYLLFCRSYRTIRETNRTLETAVQQTSVLQRVLRHTIRNVCNVIDLEVDMLEEQSESGRAEAAAERIREQTADLVALGSKAQDLRNVVLKEKFMGGPVDPVPVVQGEIEAASETHPEVVFREHMADNARVQMNGQLGAVVEELLVNAIEHNEADPPIVWVTVAEKRQRVWLTIADNGPGMPEMEREVLEAGEEKPLLHSQGIGLWLVRAIVTQAGGDLHIADNEPQGTVVRVRIPSVDATGEAPALAADA